jgi:hypothetical protein
MDAHTKGENLKNKKTCAIEENIMSHLLKNTKETKQQQQQKLILFKYFHRKIFDQLRKKKCFFFL